MASPVIAALEAAKYTGSSPRLLYWAFQHPNPDAPPQTYRLARRAGNGWVTLLAASKETKEILSFYTETDEDQKAVREALRWLAIPGTLDQGVGGPVIRLTGGKEIPASLYGGGAKK